jgi:hypothetical protein
MAFQVVEEEVLRVGVSEIKSVMVDDLALLLEPAGPAGLADLRPTCCPISLGNGA